MDDAGSRFVVKLQHLLGFLLNNGGSGYHAGPRPRRGIARALMPDFRFQKPNVADRTATPAGGGRFDEDVQSFLAPRPNCSRARPCVNWLLAQLKNARTNGVVPVEKTVLPFR